MKRETMYMEARAPDDFVFMSLYDEDINVLPRDALPEKEGEWEHALFLDDLTEENLFGTIIH